MISQLIDPGVNRDDRRGAGVDHRVVTGVLPLTQQSSRLVGTVMSVTWTRRRPLSANARTVTLWIS